jgi:hypothetical protein
MQVFGGAEVERQHGASDLIEGTVQAHGGPRASSQAKGLASSWTSAPMRARGSRRTQYCRGRRRCLAGRPRAWRSRRPVGRLIASPSTSCGFSVTRQSLKSRYVVASSRLSRAASRRGDGRPRPRWSKPSAPADSTRRFLLAHRDCLPWVDGVTLSRNSYSAKFSCYLRPCLRSLLLRVCRNSRVYPRSSVLVCFTRCRALFAQVS